ncbi:MAG: hypothetical protein AB8I08_16525 [Sandaracinaceae bacterium]
MSAGGRFMGSFLGAADDTDTFYGSGPSCGFARALDVFFSFTTSEAQDVALAAFADTGEPLQYTLQASCAPTSTLLCASGQPAVATAHALAAGTYFVVLEGPSEGMTGYTLDVEFAPPSAPTPGDTCATAIPLAPGVEAAGTFVDAQNDLATTCGFPHDDIVYTFEVTEPADLRLNFDSGSRANLSVRTDCGDPSSEAQCLSGDPTELRLRNVAPGTYYAVVESRFEGDFTLNLTSTSPPVIPTLVTGNDLCGSAELIPPTGGLYRGSTFPLSNRYLASCGGSASSRDAVFRLELVARSRVVLRTQDSEYDTVLHVHRATCTSGADLHCDDNGGEGLSALLDLELDPDTYFIIVDGFGAGSSGDYELSVEVEPL